MALTMILGGDVNLMKVGDDSYRRGIRRTRQMGGDDAAKTVMHWRVDGNGDVVESALFRLASLDGEAAAALPVLEKMSADVRFPYRGDELAGAARAERGPQRRDQVGHGPTLPPPGPDFGSTGLLSPAHRSCWG